MTFDDDRPARSPRPRPVTPPTRRSPFAIAIGVMVAFIVATVFVANIWTEVAWYRQLGYFDVWRTQWVTRIVLFAIFAVIAGLAVWASLRWAKSVRPALTATRSTPPATSPTDSSRRW